MDLGLFLLVVNVDGLSDPARDPTKQKYVI